MNSNSQNLLPNRSPWLIVFYLLLMATFAVWFGGFTLYVSIVVPIGTEILGSARAQGEITQQVTHWINLVCSLAIFLMLLEHWVGRRFGSRAKWISLAIVIVLMLSQLGLFWLHDALDELIEPAKRGIRVIDRDAFYLRHRIYLWLSTLQWICGWVWLGIFVVQMLPSSSRDLQR